MSSLIDRMSRSRRAPAFVEPLERRTFLTASVFTLDPLQSTIAISGDAGGFVFQQQFPSKPLSTTYQGSITADVDGGQITLTTSAIAARDSGLYLPGPNLGNYGITLQGSGAFVAVRNLALNLTGPATALDGGSSGAFSSSGQTIAITGGTVDADAGGLGTSSTPIAGASVGNAATGSSTLVISGDTQTLTIPITGNYFLNDPSLPLPITLNLTGQIVATAGLPAPDVNVLLNGNFTLSSGGSVDFGTADVGSAAPTRQLVVRNDGNLPMNNINLSVPTGFALVGDTLPTSLAIGASASITIAMDTAADSTPSGTLSVTSDDPDESSFNLTLGGTVGDGGDDPGPGPGPGPGVGVALKTLTLGTLPTRIIGGERKAKGQVSLQLENETNAAFSGPLTVTVVASLDTTPDSGDAPVATLTKNIKLKALTAGKPLKVKGLFPAVSADGDYFLLATVSGTGVDSTEAVAASATTVRIEKPVVNLVGATQSPAPGTFTLGKRASLPVAVINQGNVAAKGNVNAELFISTDGTLGNATLLATLPLKVSVNAGATKSLKLRATLPPAGSGIPTGNFFLLVKLTATTSPLAELNVVDGEFLPTIPLTIV